MADYLSTDLECLIPIRRSTAGDFRTAANPMASGVTLSIQTTFRPTAFAPMASQGLDDTNSHVGRPHIESGFDQRIGFGNLNIRLASMLIVASRHVCQASNISQLQAIARDFGMNLSDEDLAPMKQRI